MNERRVVVTGFGILTPVGNDIETFWSNLLAGVSGVGPITQFDASMFSSRIAGEVRDVELAQYWTNPKEARRSDRYTLLGMAAAKLALRHSGFDPASIDPSRFGVIVGSGIGGLRSLEDQHSILRDKGPARLSPFMIPMMIANMASGLIAIELGATGPNISIVTACATANHCIGEAWRLIRLGEADVFLAGGAEAAICALGIGGFCAMRALSRRNDDPTRASRPFDVDRDGFVMGEGAGILLLEELESAKARGANILCEIVGYGLSCDGYHMTAPHPEGEGAVRAMRGALNSAGLNIDDVDYINAHGTSTEVGDLCEIKAIRSLFGTHATGALSISSTKSMTGHLLGATGGVELAACILASANGVVPPTINLDTPDPSCDGLDLTPHRPKERPVRVALNNSFGFGGHNSCIAIRGPSAL